jgi:putative hemolysin
MEFLVIGLLTLLNGFFALSEIALVSAKRAKLEHLSNRGSLAAVKALKLQENPEQFLSSIQVGITLIGIISGAYGGTALADDFEKWLTFLSGTPVIGGYRSEIAFTTVIGAITYFTIVVGELVPKTLAMNNPEKIALSVSGFISGFTRFTFPVVWTLSLSTKGLLALGGVKDTATEKMSEDELRMMLKMANKQGVIPSEESQVHQNLFSFDDQNAKSLMTHRNDLEWVDLDSTAEEIDRLMHESTHSKLLVCRGSIDQVEGLINVKDYFEQCRQPGFLFSSLLRKPLFLTQNVTAFRILQLFKQHKLYLGIVVDEFGIVKGVITLHDIFEALIGDIPEEDGNEPPAIVKRTDGSYLIDGQTLVIEINQFFQRELIPYDGSRYTTISGYFIFLSNTIPQVGDRTETELVQLETVDMDGARIDKILLVIKD